MKLKDQVVSLELAKKLKDLGFKQESLFYHTENGEIEFEEQWLKAFDYKNRSPKICSAYTVAELGEMLPIISDFSPTISKHYDKFQCGYLDNERIKGQAKQPREIKFQEAETESNARAKMLIYLKENNLLK
jgi:hypothetical protein